MGLFDRRDRAPEGPAQKARYGVLLVDDEILNLTSLASLLEDDYLVHVASSANDALSMLNDPDIANSIHLIVSDQRMPNMTGVELLAQTRHMKPDAKRLLLTGYTDIDAIVGAINEAAIYKYLRKPIDSNELRLTLVRACEAWQLEQDNYGLLGELKRAYEKLELLDADKMTFLRYLSHEMNTPLNWLSAAQVIDRRTLSQETLDMLDFVDKGQDRLCGLIAVVLRYFQAAGLELRPHHERVDISVLLARQATNAQREYGETVRVRLAQPATLTVESDGALITEIIEHLLENAITHAQRTGGNAPEVKIEVQRHDREVQITISNNGDPLEGTTIEQIFQPFLFCGSQHGVDGFGLSLATARVLAIVLCGDLQVCNGDNINPGVSLQLRLPMALARQTVTASAT